VVFPGIAAANAMFGGKGGTGGSAANVLAELMRLAGAGPDTNADKIDALGTELTTDVGMDRTVFSMSVTSDKFESALKILARVVTEPLLPADEFAKIKARELDRVKQSLAGRGLWLARMQMYRVLFANEQRYRELDSMPSELDNLTLDSVKSLYQKVFTAQNALIVVSGDIDTAMVKQKVDQAFSRFASSANASTSEDSTTYGPTFESLVQSMDIDHANDTFVDLGAMFSKTEATQLRARVAQIATKTGHRLYVASLPSTADSHDKSVYAKASAHLNLREGDAVFLFNEKIRVFFVHGEKHFDDANQLLIDTKDSFYTDFKDGHYHVKAAGVGKVLDGVELLVTKIPSHIVYLVARPGSKQADVLIAMKGVSRTSDTFFEQALAADTLGGGMSSRLFTDVREKRSLAYSTSAGMRDFATGDTLFSLYAGTQTEKAPNSLNALLENWKQFTSKKPTDASELQIAQKSLETSFLFRLETVGSIANLAIEQYVLHLPGVDVYDYVQNYRNSLTSRALKDVDAFEKTSMSKWQPTIVVAGDPKLKNSLRRFGTVYVIDPEKDFAKVEEVAANPNEPLPAPVSSAKPK
jgi:predicted Zn-dependent peptidase